MKVKTVIINNLLVICVIMAIGSGALLAREVVREKDNKKILESVAAVVEAGFNGKNAAETDASEGETGENSADAIEVLDGRILGYQVLKEENEDLVGWVYVPGTEINYPVMQTLEEPEFYLDHNFDREKSTYGVPFVDGNCNLKNEGCNVIVYGHHMKDGSMFADLMNYTEQSFYESHSKIQFDTLSERAEYQILGAMMVPAVESESEFYSDILASDENQYQEFIKEVKKRSLYETGVEVKAGDKLLTLITCEYSSPEGRMVVVAKKIP